MSANTKTTAAARTAVRVDVLTKDTSLGPRPASMVGRFCALFQTRLGLAVGPAGIEPATKGL